MMSNCAFCKHYETCKFVDALRKLDKRYPVFIDNVTDWIFDTAKYCEYYDEDTTMIENTIKNGLMFVFQSSASDTKRTQP